MAADRIFKYELKEVLLAVKERCLTCLELQKGETTLLSVIIL